MNKSDYQELIRKTKYASHKKRLTKKELKEVVKSMTILGIFGKKENFAEKPKIKTIGQILKGE